jgi:hypothetical protein
MTDTTKRTNCRSKRAHRTVSESASKRLVRGQLLCHLFDPVLRRAKGGVTGRRYLADARRRRARNGGEEWFLTGGTNRCIFLYLFSFS